MPAAEPGRTAPPARATGLADGEWHRLHPLTPVLRGGFGLVAVIGVIIANLRERFLGFFFDDPEFEPEGDPIDFVVQEGLVGVALLAVLVILLLSVLGFYLSWRFHTFRITSEVVEVRSGIVFRTNRKARLDRVQGINLNRPFFARLFGTAKLEITQAGQDANVQLSYLASGQADDLRREILRLASGAVEHSVADEVAGLPEQERRNVLEQRVSELLAPELDPKLAAAESVVKIHPGRLAGSILLSESTLILLAMIVAAFALVVVTGELVAMFGIVPGILGLGGYLVSRFTKSLRYSIASTPDGVRVGFGLLSTSNDTLPPGRIHSVSISQSILWRPSGWWQIKVNRASRSTNSSQQQQRSVILPVGSLDEAMRVLELLLPGLERMDLLREGLVSRGGDDGFVNSPRRAVWLRWFSWRRNGFAVLPDSVVLRRGAIWRELVLVPLPRLQSTAITQGPLLRGLDLAAVHLHTVSGPITGRLGAVDREAALGFFREVSAAAIESAQSDTSHRWRSRESVS